MVSDEQIARGVEILLHQSQSDPHQYAAVSSLNGVVEHLGAKLGLDLSHKASFIADHINHLRRYNHLQALQQQPPVVGKDYLGFQNHPQFLSAQLYQQRLHQQQQQQFPGHFAVQFPGFRAHAPRQQSHAPPQQQLHVTSPQSGQHAVTVAAVSPKEGSAPSKSSKESTQTGAKRRGGAGGLNKLCGVSAELQVIVGEAAMARTEIVKQLWAYIRSNNLQDPSNKRKIICDEALRAVFEIDCTDMFKMNKLLSKHILPLDPAKAPDRSKRQKVDVESTAAPTEVVDGAATTVTISDALAVFLGATSREMLASEATQRVLDYIKTNSLEDPSSMTVACDEKLKELFGCESIPILGINDMLARHHIVQSS